MSAPWRRHRHSWRSGIVRKANGPEQGPQFDRNSNGAFQGRHFLNSSFGASWSSWRFLWRPICSPDLIRQSTTPSSPRRAVLPTQWINWVALAHMSYNTTWRTVGQSKPLAATGVQTSSRASPALNRCRASRRATSPRLSCSATYNQDEGRRYVHIWVYSQLPTYSQDEGRSWTQVPAPHRGGTGWRSGVGGGAG